MIYRLPLAFIIVLQGSARKTLRESCSPEILARPLGQLALLFLPHQSLSSCPFGLGPELDTEQAQELSTWETDKIDDHKALVGEKHHREVTCRECLSKGKGAAVSAWIVRTTKGSQVRCSWN